MSREWITVFPLCSGLCRCTYFPFATGCHSSWEGKEQFPGTLVEHPDSPWHFLSPAGTLAQLSKLWCYTVLSVSFGVGGTGSGVTVLCCAWKPVSRLLPNATPVNPTLTGLLLPWTKEAEAWHFFFLKHQQAQQAQTMQIDGPLGSKGTFLT